MKVRDEISGSVILDQAAVLREQVGDATFAKILGAMPKHLAEELNTATTVSWLDVQAFVALYEAAGNVTGRDPADIHRGVARVSLERVLKGVWRMLLRLVSDEQLLKRAPVLFAKGYNQGRLELALKQPGQAVLEVRDWDAMPAVCRRGLAVAISIALEMGNRKNVQVKLDPTVTHARYLASWNS